MKKLLYLILICFVGFSISSCSKSNSDTATVTVDLSATVDGTPKDSKSVSAIKSGTSLVIAAPFNLASGETVLLSISNFAGVGDYAISATGGVTAYYTTGLQSTANQFVAINGDIKITAVTATSISGTFQFVGSNSSASTKTITSGQFTSNLTSQ
jgi:hypothetical protein